MQSFTPLSLCTSVVSEGNPEPADKLERPWFDWLRRVGSWRDVSFAASQERENPVPVRQAPAHDQEKRRELHVQGSHPGQLKRNVSQRDVSAHEQDFQQIFLPVCCSAVTWCWWRLFLRNPWVSACFTTRIPNCSTQCRYSNTEYEDVPLNDSQTLSECNYLS